MTTGTDLPVMAAAPMYLRESLYMPYTFGLDFARDVLQKDGTQAAYAGALEHPPIDTLQIMRPQTYLDKQMVPPLNIPDLDKLIAPDYERYDFAGMGAFDMYLLAKQYAPESDAKTVLLPLARWILSRGPRQVSRRRTRSRLFTFRVGTRRRRRGRLLRCTAATPRSGMTSLSPPRPVPRLRPTTRAT